MLLIGAGGMSVSLVLAELALASEEMEPGLKLIPILAYVGFFCVGLGATVWVVMSEIFPTRIRGRAMSIPTLSLWAACFVVAQTFPDLMERYKESAFRIYVVMCIVMIVFVTLVVPETKGKSLEQIERMWHRRDRKGLAEAEDAVSGREQEADA